MKTKRTVISIFTLCTALLFTACSGKGTSNTEASRDTQTEAASEASGNSNTTLDDLYQQENQLFAEHEDVWNKAFGMIKKALLIQVEITPTIWLPPSNQIKTHLQTMN